MLKIMVVDDEPIFVDRICMSVNWELYGFRICCTAYDGKEALAKAEEYRPDIALVDINMPYIDGLKLTELLKEKLLQTVVVLISGYSEFEYAQKAVKLGVEDYILKPYEDGELIEVLLRIKDKILKVRLEEAIQHQNRRTLEESRIRALFSGENIPDEELNHILTNAGFDSDFQSFNVACIEIDSLYQKWSDISEISLWKFAVSNIAEEYIKFNGKHLVYSGPEDRIVIILGFRSKKENEELNLEQFNRLCRAIHDMLHFSVTIGIGGACMPSNLTKSYLEAVTALQNKLVLGNNKAINYRTLEMEATNAGFYTSEINNELLVFLRQNDLDKIEEKINQIFEYIREKRFLTDYTYVICIGMVSICLSFIVQIGGNIEEIFGKDFSPLSRIKSYESIEGIRNWLLEVFRRTLDFTNKSKSTKSRKLAEYAKVYIVSHFNNPDIQIEDIARELFVSENYLMAVFKKEFGITVVDYIANIRMLKAKELIHSSNFKLSSVSSMVGFNDPGYFSKCFKKHFGITPSEYENEVRK